MIISVYPREYGEREEDARKLICNAGLSPRVRGTLGLTRATVGLARFIPASTGNAIGTTSTSGAAPVYPREYGERIVPPSKAIIIPGLSPRVRGTRIKVRPMVKKRRFIPASTGNAEQHPALTVRNAVYPREYGERTPLILTSRSQYGLSPRVRGTHYKRRSSNAILRFIPASTGNAAAQF